MSKYKVYFAGASHIVITDKDFKLIDRNKKKKILALSGDKYINVDNIIYIERIKAMRTAVVPPPSAERMNEEKEGARLKRIGSAESILTSYKKKFIEL